MIKTLTYGLSAMALAASVPAALAQDAEDGSQPDNPTENGDGANVTLGDDENVIETPADVNVTRTVTVDGERRIVNVEVDRPETPAANPDIPDRPDLPDGPDLPDLPDRPEKAVTPDLPDRPDLPDIPDHPHGPN